jgi:glycosyltransferase involved in cell wall biosynthesis
MITVLQMVYSISVDRGGLGVAALRFAQSLKCNGTDVILYVIDPSDSELTIGASQGEVKVVGEGGDFYSQYNALRNLFEKFKFDIVHLHGTWTPILAVACHLASMMRIPVAVSPHGCLEPWALQHRGWKKKIALLLYQRRIFEKAAMLVATSNQELESIRQLSISTPVAVIPNGVDIPVANREHIRGVARKFLFLSRIHPIKGLPDLVAAWKSVRQPGWKIVIAGPDEDGHLGEIQSQISALGIGNDFEFPGLVTGERKEQLFDEADVFILPTHSENFGIVVAEALARGIPVITTKGAPWEDLTTWRCGWWVQTGAEGIAQALSSAMNTSQEELAKRGQRGIQLVKEKYSWDRIGRDAMQAYHWMLGNTQQAPDFVTFSKRSNDNKGRQKYDVNF